MSNIHVHDSEFSEKLGLLKPDPPTRSSISPTPRSLRGQTPSSVRFSDAAESISYSSTFEDAPTDTRTTSALDTAVIGRTSYTDTFVSETLPLGVRASRSLESLSQKSLHDESSVGLSYSDTFEVTSTASRHQRSRDRDLSTSGYSLYTSETDRDSQSTVKSVIDSHRWPKTEDTQSSLRSRFEYTDSFETSDLSTSEEESDTGLPTISEDDARYEFVRHLMNRLRGEKDASVRKSTDTLSQRSATTKYDQSSADSGTSAKYCMDKIKLLKRKKKYGLDCRVPLQTKPEKKQVPVTEYGFHPSVIEKLKTKSFMAAMERACNAEIHEPRHCPECRKVMEEVEEREQRKIFIRGKVVDLQRKIMEDKICNHLVKMDSLTLIGDILRDLPRISDSPTQIEKLLNKPLEDYHSNLTADNTDTCSYKYQNDVR